MRRLMLFAVLTGLAIAPPARGDDAKQGWDPRAAVDLLQPGYSLSGDSRQLHLTLVGTHVSLLRFGRFRLPSLGVDLQARCNQCEDSYERSWTGHWLLTSGVKFVIEEETNNGAEGGIHAKAFYDTRRDADPRIGRWGFVVGAYVGF